MCKILASFRMLLEFFFVRNFLNSILRKIYYFVRPIQQYKKFPIPNLAKSFFNLVGLGMEANNWSIYFIFLITANWSAAGSPSSSASDSASGLATTPALASGSLKMKNIFKIGLDQKKESKFVKIWINGHHNGILVAMAITFLVLWSILGQLKILSSFLGVF